MKRHPDTHLSTLWGESLESFFLEPNPSHLQDLSLTHSTSLRKFLLGDKLWEPQPLPQEEKLLGTAWAYFSAIMQIFPVLSKPERVLLQHFRFGLFDHTSLD